MVIVKKIKQRQEDTSSIKDNSLIYKCHNCGVGANLFFLKHLDKELYNEFMTENFREQPERFAEIKLKEETKKFIKETTSKLRSVKKISQLPIEHPARKFCDMRMITNNKHYLIYYTDNFYKFINTLVENKFPSIQKDHPRLLILFF